MMATLKLLKGVSKRCKFSVYGYIRLKQKELSLSNIPPLICHLCLQFYWIDECFDKCGFKAEISNDKMMVKALDNPDMKQNVYGKFCIESLSGGVATWTFKLFSPNSIHTFTKIIISATDNLEKRGHQSPFYYFLVQ